jgi:hypothetical protein
MMAQGADRKAGLIGSFMPMLLTSQVSPSFPHFAGLERDLDERVASDQLVERHLCGTRCWGIVSYTASIEEDQITEPER